MERFTRVYYNNEKLHIKTCPIIIEAGAILKDNENDSIIAQLKLRSISESKIKSVVVSLELFDSAKKVQKKMAEQHYLDLDISQNEEFGYNVAIPLPYENARSFEVIIREVVYLNGEVWTNKNNEKCYIVGDKRELTTVLNDVEIEIFKDLYGYNAKYIPEVKENIWICTCGCIYETKEKSCTNCNFKKEDINKINFDEIKKYGLYKQAIEKFNSNLIEKINESITTFSKLGEYKDAKEYINKGKTKISKLKKKEKQNKKTDKIVVISLLSLLLITIVTLCTIRVIIPNYKYSKANKLCNEKKYIDAIKIYEELGDFKDSEQKFLAARYNYALELFNQSKFEEAYLILEDLNMNVNIQTSSDEVKNINYKYAEYIIEDNPDKAYEIFDNIGDYQESNKKKIYAAINASNYYKDKKEYLTAYDWYVKSNNQNEGLELLYSYIITVNIDAENTELCEMLKILKENNYKDAKEIFDKIYHKSVEVIINNSEDSLEPVTKVNRSETAYIHYKIIGMYPGEKMHIRFETTYIDSKSGKEKTAGFHSNNIDSSSNNNWEVISFKKLSGTKLTLSYSDDGSEIILAEVNL